MPNDNFESLTVQFPPEMLKVQAPFKDLFPIRESVLSGLIDDMNINGFDPFHPIVTWRGSPLVVVDGHTRLRAAIAAGLTEVSVAPMEFANEEDALDYAIKSQRNRRNLTDAELFACVQQMYRNKKSGRSQMDCVPVLRGKAARALGETLGISCRMVEKFVAIGRFASDDIKETLRRGGISVSRAYEETMNPRRVKIINVPDPDAELVHSMMAAIHANMNTVQIRKLVKSLQLELAIN